jgi:hypothetical protein
MSGRGRPSTARQPVIQTPPPGAASTDVSPASPPPVVIATMRQPVPGVHFMASGRIRPFASRVPTAHASLPDVMATSTSTASVPPGFGTETAPQRAPFQRAVAGR